MQTPLLGFRPTRQGLFVPDPVGLAGFERQGMDQAKKGFDPSKIGGVQFWFDCADTGTMTRQAGGAVLTWRDKIRGTVVTSSSPGQQVMNKTIGVIPVIRFPETSWMNATVPAGPNTTSSSFSIIALAVVNSPGAAYAPSVVSAYGRGLGIAGPLNAGSPPTNSPQTVFGGSFRSTSTGPVLNNNARGYILSTFLPAGGGQEQLRVDGAAPTGYSPTSATEDMTANTLIEIGTRAGGGEPWDGWCGDVIIGARMSFADHVRLEGWLAWKYGQQSFLAATHPHRNSPP